MALWKKTILSLKLGNNAVDILAPKSQVICNRSSTVNIDSSYRLPICIYLLS